ncbi:hypothetical protein BHE90_012320 [Fusarium euwallaceae]|uniref:Uncharacterized protein n=1 Tax=Fusarium euwallaceae TaxID=1147111 RepID=A0A430LBY5_9HYPO|nr:hypothetical protein BHE90_012320 [Fusarium euwallaceae]
MEPNKPMPPLSRAACLGTSGIYPFSCRLPSAINCFVPPVNLSCALSSTTSMPFWELEALILSLGELAPPSGSRVGISVNGRGRFPAVPAAGHESLTARLGDNASARVES